MFTINIINQVNPDEQLKKEVMLRIKLIYLFRRYSSPLAIECLLFLAFSTVMALLVSIRSIFQNISNLTRFSETVPYIANAAIHTTLTVQVMMLGSMVLAVIIGRNFYRSIKTA